jgi:2-polyprenyl-6-methoxyphenol hydroxylase-like FAD-dependent oxidoreductase
MRVTIIGGGVAGSAAAIALCRIGAQVTVYEAYEDAGGRVGSFLSLAVNGLRGLAALGCLADVQRAGFPVSEQRMWSSSGKPLGVVPRGRRADDPLHSITLMRADLVTVLREHARTADARILTGQRADEDDTADLVVGADGIWSTTRQRLDPATPSYAGLYSVSGTAKMPADPPHPGSFNMIMARRGAFLYLPAPDGTVWWSAQIAAPQPPDNPDLMEMFRTEHRALDILRGADPGRTGTRHHVLPAVRTQHDDRTVLIGDAAHPVGAGQGASMAIEDAVVLARVLADQTVPAALKAFDDERRNRLDKMARMATRNRDAKTAGPLARRMRDLVMPHAFPRFYPRATGWLYDYEVGEVPAPAAASRA